MHALAQSQPGAPPSHFPPPPRRAMRADIMALAAADAALGLRFMPPAAAAPAMAGGGGRGGLGFFPAFPQYFVPPVPAASPTSAAAASAHPLAASERPVRSRASSGAGSASGTGAPPQQRGGWGRPPEPPTRSGGSGTVARKHANAAAPAAAAQQSKSVARLSAPRSRRGSASKSAATAAPAPSQPEEATPVAAVPAGPSAATAAATVSAAPSAPTTPRSHASQAPSGAVAAAPAAPRTPRTPRSSSQPGSRLASPRSSVPNSPRSGRTPSRRLSASTRGRGHTGGGGSQSQPKLLDESEVRRLMAQLLSEAGLSGEVLLDAEARSTHQGSHLAAERAARADLVAREQEERQRRLEEETRRPHYYLHQARSEAGEFRDALMPLLAQADRALERIQHRAAGPSGAGIQSASLASNLSHASAQLVARNADTLSDMVLDALLGDTVSVLNLVEEQKRLDHAAKVDAGFLGDAWEAVQNYEAQRERMQEKYRLAGETCVRQHLPEIQLEPSPQRVPLQQQQRREQQGAAPVAPAPSPSFHTSPSPSPEMRAPLWESSQHQPPHQHQQQPQSVRQARSVYPPASTFITPSSVTAANAAAVAATSPLSRAAVPSGFASLPALPGLVASVQADQAAFERHVAERNQQQFLMPHQVQLHTIVAAVGDDILDSLLASVCLEVGDVCDKYVERVFDAEFEIDLDQMAEQDWNEQIQMQQQQQPQQPFQQEHVQHEQQPVQ